MELPPLYEVVDPDALDSVVEAGLSVSFRYAGCEVHVEDGEAIATVPPTAEMVAPPQGQTH